MLAIDRFCCAPARAFLTFRLAARTCFAVAMAIAPLSARALRHRCDRGTRLIGMINPRSPDGFTQRDAGGRTGTSPRRAPLRKAGARFGALADQRGATRARNSS